MKIEHELDFYKLSEIINIGTKCATQVLSDVIGKTIQPPVSKVELIRLSDVSISSLKLESEKFSTVTLEFVGKLNIQVMLSFSEETVLYVIQKMMSMETYDIDTVHEFISEGMCELGNLMINACLSAITETLKIPIESTLPCYKIKSANEIVMHIKGMSNKEFILVSHINFSIEGVSLSMTGKIFFLLN